MAEEKAENLVSEKKTKRNMLVLSAALVIAAVIIAILYFAIWRYKISTDNAYVKGDIVQVTPKVSGSVFSIHVDDTDVVQAGDVLVTLDDTDMQIAFETAKSQLASAVKSYWTQKAQVYQSKVAIEQAEAEKGEAEAKFASAKIAHETALGDYQRRKKLEGTNAISNELMAHAKDTYESAKADMDAAEASVLTAQTQIDAAKAAYEVNASMIGYDLPLREQPDVEAAIASVKNAWINLQRVTIKAPVSGEIASKNIQIGQTTSAGTALMTIIPLNRLWVDANFKENQLEDIMPGQEVTMTSDLYGKNVVYHGVVQGLSAGTGSAFAILPAENATGNWIKVVQRVPVRVSLDQEEVAKHPLRVGLSMNVEIDSRNHAQNKQTEGKQIKGGVLSEQINPNVNGADKIINEILNKQ